MHIGARAKQHRDTLEHTCRNDGINKKIEGEKKMRRKSVNRAVALLLTLAIVVALCACGGGSALKGAWAAEGGRAPSGFPDSIEFFNDGKCAADGMSAEYKLEGNRLMLSVMGIAYMFDYKLSGGVLTLSDDYASADYHKS